MVSIILTIILAFLFIFSGRLIPGLKKLQKLITSYILKFLSFFGIKISKREKTVKISKEFKETYKDIKVVKLSKKNLKQLNSINWTYLIVFIVTVLLVFFNLGAITGNAISNWLYSGIISKIPLLNKLIKSAVDTNTLYTATMFSILSFSATKIIQRWKETKQQRKENKEALLKLRATKLMSSKELLDYAKSKDEEKYKELK